MAANGSGCNNELPIKSLTKEKFMNSVETKNESKPLPLGAVSGSALIVEFMGIKEIQSYYDSYGTQVPIYYTSYWEYRTPAYSIPNMSMECFLGNCKFNSSWDWFMPVYAEMSRVWCNIPDSQKKKFKGTKTYRAIQNRIGLVELHNAYELTVLFIQEWKSFNADR